MSTKLTYTGAEVQELLDKIEKGDFDNAKTLEGLPASYFAIASEFTSLAESFATEQGRVNTLYSYFNNGSANDALSLGGKLPSYYATATQYEILQRTLSDFKSLFDSMFEKDSEGNIHAKLSLWSSGGITAGGVGSGGSGGGGISYNRLDSWSDYSADKAGYVLSALLGKDLDNRVSALANAGYITASYLAPYALRSEIPSLVGYATQSWVGDNYLSKSGGVITGQGDYAYVQLRLSGDIATIGFQQYGVDKGVVGWWSAIGVRLQNTNAYGLAVTDSNDPIYYWGENGSVQRILLHAGNYADYITNSYLKSTLGISDWALASVKPTYTASEVGAFPQTGGLISTGNPSPIVLDNKDPNYPEVGLKIALNRTNKAWMGYTANTGVYFYTYSGAHKLGLKDDGVGFIDYNTILHSGNYSDYALPLSGGTVNGSITATSFIGNLTGNADSATKLATPRTIWGQSFDGTGDITGPLHLGNNISIRCYSTSGSKISTLILDPSNTLLLGYDMSNIGGTVLYGKALAMRYGTSRTMGFLLNEYGNVAIGGATADEKLHVYGNGKFTGSVTASSLTIGGTSTISGDLKGLQNLIFADGYLGRKFSLTNSGGIFFQAPSCSGGWATNWTVKSNDGITSFGDLAGAFGEGDSLRYFYFGGEHTAPSIAIMPSGMIAIGGTTADEKLHVHGNGKFTGALTAPAITTNSLTIGGVTLTYDSGNEALCINGNMYALGGITAGGAGISAYTSLEARVARLEQQLNI